MRHAVIMAGGAGTRLWPLSRHNRPKQLLRLFAGKSLLRIAFERLRGVFEPEQIHIITVADHLPMIAEELPELPGANLIGEPVGRDTANAVGFSAAILARRDPDATIGVFTADHLIRPEEVFACAVGRGLAAAEADPTALVTFGVTPTFAHTGLGYIHRGERIDDDLYVVQQFKEKPDEPTAERYVACGEYDWNSGMFAWRAEAILGELARHLPASHEALVRIADGWDGPDGPRLAAELYPTLEKISIDFAVMERAARVLVVSMPVEWLDVGSWPAVGAAVGADEADNVVVAPTHVKINSKNNIVVTEDDHLVALVGVENLVVIHSPDATLVCHQRESQRIKDLVAALQAQHGKRFL